MEAVFCQSVPIDRILTCSQGEVEWTMAHASHSQFVSDGTMTTSPSFQAREDHTARGFRAAVTRARNGDDEVWTALISDYEPGLRKAADSSLGSYLRHEVDSADLVQEVHWSLWHGLREGKYELVDRRCLIALSLTILKCKISRLWRRLERRRRLATQEMRTVGRNGEDSILSLSAEDPFQEVLADDEYEHLAKRLTETEHHLLQLRLQGYSTAEAARLLNKKPDSLRMVLKRLRAKARAHRIGPESMERTQPLAAV